jgi:molecular chaperone DnaK
MVQDAEANAEDDRKFHELVQTRNQADAMLHSVKKALEERGDQLSESDKTSIQSAVQSVDDALKGEDKEAIDKAVEYLGETTQKFTDILFGQGTTTEDHKASQEQQNTTEHEGDVVDAEFEEVKDKK